MCAWTLGEDESKGAVKLPSELSAYEAAEQRVDAGDEAAEAHLQGEGQVRRLPGCGVVGIHCPHHDGCVAAHVVGQVKQRKEDQGRAQDPPEPPLLVVRVGAAGPVAQLPEAVQAAVTDREQREDETDEGADDGIGEALSGLTQHYVQGTDGAVAPRASLDHTHGGNRYAEEHGGHPHRHAQQAGLPPAQQHQGAQGVHDGQVPVHTDAGDEEDAQVEVVVVEHPHARAEAQPQLPVQVVQVVVDEEGQDHQPGGVSQGQVEEEHRAAGPAPQAVEEHPEREQVEGKPEDQNHQEEGWHHVELDHR